MTTARFLSLFALSLYVSLSALASAATDNTKDLLAKVSHPEPSGFTLTADTGVTIFTAGLGTTVNPGVSLGVRAGYLFADGLAIELSGSYSSHLDIISGNDGASSMQLNTNVFPILAGVRYYFLTGPMPEAIARPYFGGGGGLTFRTQSLVPGSLTGFTLVNNNGTTTAPTLFLAIGTDFSLVQNHLYLGADARLAFTFWTDSNFTYGGEVTQGSRAGSLLLLTANLTWVI